MQNWKSLIPQGFEASNWTVDGNVSRPPRYDHFDIPPYMNCRQADFIGYSIFLEIFLEMLFSVAFGVPEKSVFTRLFCVFATDMLANFQDSLVVTASICIRMKLCLYIISQKLLFVNDFAEIFYSFPFLFI